MGGRNARPAESGRQRGGGDAAGETGLDVLSSQTSTGLESTPHNRHSQVLACPLSPPFHQVPNPTDPHSTSPRHWDERTRGKNRRGIFPLAWGLAPFPLHAQLGARVRHWGRRGGVCNLRGSTMLVMMGRGPRKGATVMVGGTLASWVASVMNVGFGIVHPDLPAGRQYPSKQASKSNPPAAVLDVNPPT